MAGQAVHIQHPAVFTCLLLIDCPVPADHCPEVSIVPPVAGHWLQVLAVHPADFFPPPITEQQLALLADGLVAGI